MIDADFARLLGALSDDTYPCPEMDRDDPALACRNRVKVTINQDREADVTGCSHVHGLGALGPAGMILRSYVEGMDAERRRLRRIVGLQ